MARPAVVLRAGTALFARPTRGGSGLALPTADRAAEAPGFVAELLEERGDVVRAQRRRRSDRPVAALRGALGRGRGLRRLGRARRPRQRHDALKLAHTDPDGTALEHAAGTPAARSTPTSARRPSGPRAGSASGRAASAAVGASYALDPLPPGADACSPGCRPSTATA
ncbi:MAG: hypothetical protein U1F43_03785 [Myxococcota bacterium]